MEFEYANTVFCRRFCSPATGHVSPPPPPPPPHPMRPLPPDYGRVPITAADAALVAAAPAMLDALRDALAELEDRDCPCVDGIRAAIAAAEGN